MTALVDRVRQRLATAGGAPADRLDAATVAEALRAEAGVVGDAEVLDALRTMQEEFIGAGPLEPLLAHAETTDVLVSSPEQVWVDRGAGLLPAEVSFQDEDAVRRLAQRLASAAGRRLDDAQPFVDAQLPSGIRLHAVLPPIAAAGTCISLRVLRPATHDLATLAATGTFDAAMADVLRAIVQARLAYLVVGGTGSGKTTLLASLLGCVQPQERIVCVEDAGELAPQHPHVVRLLGRAPNVEGAGEISLRDLVRQALRMRPDRLVVGEVRGAEVRELLGAMNTGHEGGAGTVHANSPAELPARMEALAAMAGLGRAALHSQLAAALQVVLAMRRLPTGRVLDEIGLLQRDGELAVVEPIWRRDQGWLPGGRERLAEQLNLRGVLPPW